MRLLSTIKRRLQLGFGVTVLLILAAGLLAIVGLQQAGARSQALVGEVRHEQETVQNVAYRLLQEVLVLPAPHYHHHELIGDETGRKLSKSAGDISLRALREQGVSAEGIRRALGFG